MGIFSSNSAASKNEILEQLYYKYGKLMLHIAFDVLNDLYLAQDAVQMAFLSLGKLSFNISAVEDAKTRSFMAIIARNYAYKIYCKNNKASAAAMSEEMAEIPDPNMLPIDIIISNEKISEVRRTLDRMDSKYSDIIMLKYFSDYSNSEISSLLDISEQLVRVRLCRGKKLLLEMMDGGERS